MEVGAEIMLKKVITLFICFVMFFTFAAGCMEQQKKVEKVKTEVDSVEINELEQLNYKQAPVDNPLKGFVPYKGSYPNFPYSLEWFYVPLSALMDGPDSFTFETGLDSILDEIASRGHQAVFRVYLDYPAKQDTGVPAYLVNEGLKFFEYSEHGGGRCPDYSDDRLISALELFIEAFGKKYDGDPRIGFITMGLIGFWGEWHTYPHNDWMPAIQAQDRILEAYDKAFNKTKILLRYPDTGNSAKMNMGYHDDSFSYQTLPGQSWNFMSRMELVGALDKWKKEPIGGELRPEIQLGVWSQPPDQSAEDYDKCLEQTHATWLIAHSIFTDLSMEDERYKKAYEGARKLGYELYVPFADIQKTNASGQYKVGVKIRNTGIAPFYYDWKVRLGVIEGESELVENWETDWTVAGIMPGTSDKLLEYSIDAGKLEKGTYKLVMRVENPIPKGFPLRFANTSQDEDLDGWLTLKTFKIG